MYILYRHKVIGTCWWSFKAHVSRLHGRWPVAVAHLRIPLQVFPMIHGPFPCDEPPSPEGSKCFKRNVILISLPQLPNLEGPWKSKSATSISHYLSQRFLMFYSSSSPQILKFLCLITNQQGKSLEPFVHDCRNKTFTSSSQKTLLPRQEIAIASCIPIVPPFALVKSIWITSITFQSHKTI